MIPEPLQKAIDEFQVEAKKIDPHVQFQVRENMSRNESPKLVDVSILCISPSTGTGREYCAWLNEAGESCGVLKQGGGI